MKSVHFSDIAEHNKYFDLPAPEHPQLSVLSVGPQDGNNIISCVNGPIRITNDFYSVSLKKLVSGEIVYGRTKYDFKNGTMLFFAPRQEFVLKALSVNSGAISILFHEDFIRNHKIRERIKKYGFFSYTANEALHLSPKEEVIIDSIMRNIETEYHSNPDEFSKDIILSHLDTLLKYSDRFYKRQFINRKDLSNELLEEFENLISAYIESGKPESDGLPNIQFIAQELGMSPRYLSDSLKAETGKTALEHIHLYLINEAKNLLLSPSLSISEVAYKLGFEYPQYFSRLFKKKVGVSPKEYRAQQVLH